MATTKTTARKTPDLNSKDANASLRIMPDLRNRLKAHAALNRRPLLDVTNEAILDYLRRQPAIKA